MLCQECDKKANCKKLCESAARYVNQDYGHQKERTHTGMSRMVDMGAGPESGNIDLDDLSRRVNFPYTFGELMGAPQPLCKICHTILLPPLAPHQKVCLSCTVENVRKGWRKAQRAARIRKAAFLAKPEPA